MQLSIFDVPAEQKVLPIGIEEKTYFEKWRMLELLDSLNGQKFLIRGKDDYQEFCLPFSGGAMSFSQFIYKKDFPVVCGFHSQNKKATNATLSGYLNNIVRENEKLFFNFDRTVYQTNQKQILTDDSVVSFDLRPHFIDMTSNNPKNKKRDKFNELSLEEQKNAIVGNTFAVQVRCHNDLFREIISLPSGILDIQVHEDEINLIGSNHLFIQAKGFVRFRDTGNLLIDIYNADGGYTRTISLID